MITIYATFDSRYVMSKKLYPAAGLLQRNKEKFETKTKDCTFIVSEDAYDLFLKPDLKHDHDIIVVSEALYRRHSKPGDWNFVVADGVTIVTGYRKAFEIASQERKNVTILGGPDLIQQAVRQVGNVQRMYLVQVEGSFPGDMEFPMPIADFFDLADDDDWPANGENPHRAHFFVYWRK